LLDLLNALNTGTVMISATKCGC